MNRRARILLIVVGFIAACCLSTGIGLVLLSDGQSQWERESVIRAAKDLPEGMHGRQDLPASCRVKRLAAFYVDPRGGYVLEYSSESTIDLNPAYVFVGCETADPEAVARELCDRAGVLYRGPLTAKGWYAASGQ